MKTTLNSEFRKIVDVLIQEGDWAGVSRMLEDLWRETRGVATAQYIVSTSRKIRENTQIKPGKVAILRSFTVEPVVPLLKAAAVAEGRLDLDVKVGDFNTYAQDILNDESWLYSFDPEVVILAVQTRDIAPELWQGYHRVSKPDLDKLKSRTIADFRLWIRQLRERTSANVIIHGLAQPPWKAEGIYDAQDSAGQSGTIREINRELVDLAREFNGVFVLDYDSLVARHGRSNWHDERKWLTVRLPISANCLLPMAREWARYAFALLGVVKKVVVTDLDNTLWPGVIGEDGVDGIKLDGEYPGAFFLELQHTLLDLRSRGILLAVCSKNNPEDASQMLERNPNMVLRQEHFAAVRCNWVDKAQNLRDIASELNVGTDSLVFLDDNPVERERVRSELPEVTVIDLPAEPAGLASSVRDCIVLDRLTLSADDRARPAQYKQQKAREAAAQSANSLEDFYYSLSQEVEIVPAGPDTLARIAQLTRKTNQFNLTTKRYQDEAIDALRSDPSKEVVCARVRDRFGDNGIVGVCITSRRGTICEIDTLLLSCRVIGRTVETALLSYIAEHAIKAGATELQGWFIPTLKNAPAAEFYTKHSFEKIEEKEGASLWSLKLGESTVECPQWIQLTVPREGARDFAYS